MPEISIIRSFPCNSSWVWTISLTKLQLPQCCAKWSYKDDGQALHTAFSYFTNRHFFYSLYCAARSGCSFNIVNITHTKSQFIPEAFFCLWQPQHSCAWKEHKDSWHHKSLLYYLVFCLLTKSLLHSLSLCHKLLHSSIALHQPCNLAENKTWYSVIRKTNESISLFFPLSAAC